MSDWQYFSRAQMRTWLAVDVNNEVQNGGGHVRARSESSEHVIDDSGWLLNSYCKFTEIFKFISVLFKNTDTQEINH
jgi:hypothetical protein